MGSVDEVVVMAAGTRLVPTGPAAGWARSSRPGAGLERAMASRCCGATSVISPAPRGRVSVVAAGRTGDVPRRSLAAADRPIGLVALAAARGSVESPLAAVPDEALIDVAAGTGSSSGWSVAVDVSLP
jgi:hypothetical protein